MNVLKYDANTIKISLALPEFSRSKIRSFSPQTWSSATSSYLLSNLLKSIHLGILYNAGPKVHTFWKTLAFIHSPLIQFKIIPFAWATHCFALCLLALEVKIDCKLNLYIPSNVEEVMYDYWYDKIFVYLNVKCVWLTK